MEQTLAQQTLEALKSIPLGDLRKAINQGTGLVSYDLEGPSKKLYPVLTPLRNKLARIKDGKGGTAVNWRAVTAIAPASAQLPVEEGKRNAQWNPTTANYIGTYKGYGMEQSVTFEGDYASQSFEDVKALAVLMNLQSAMIGEEKLILGGNTSIALGTAGTITLSAVGTGGSISGSPTISVSCAILTHEGWSMATVAGGVVTSTTRTNADGTTTTINGGTSQISTVQTVVVGAGSTNSVLASIPTISGAVAYAWFWGTSTGAAQTLGAITTLNSVVLKTSSGSGTQTALATGLNADKSQDALAFDGIISIACGAGMVNPAGASSGAYINYLPTGTAGIGTTLTSDGAGGVVEIDTMLQDRWDNYRLGFTDLWLNSQQAKDVTRLVVGNNGSPLIRLTGDIKGDASQMLGIAGGTFVKSYFNKFTGEMMNVHIHPNLPAGILIATADELPYPVNEVGTVWQMRLRRDYYQIEWPVTTRSYPYGIYCDGFLQHYFPAAIGIIGNIAPMA